MPKKPLPLLSDIRLGKFVHGGQALAEDEQGMKLFVWGGLPGELVDVQIIKKRRSYREGIVTVVHEASEERRVPAEPKSYLSTSPWQIVSTEAEQAYKDQILRETFDREGVADVPWQEFSRVPASGRAAQARIHSEPGAMRNPEGVSHYRNKMEYGFWGDDDGLHLAHYVRGTHGKQIVDPRTSSLGNSDVAAGAHQILQQLQQLDIRAGDLKTVIIRADTAHKTAFALFVKRKDIDFRVFEQNPPNLAIYYSDPKSPASVPTELLYSFGDITLMDTLLSKNIMYDVLSFFQVNLPVFEHTLKIIADHTPTFSTYVEKVADDRKKQGRVGASKVVDMYSGVGAIGLCVGADVLVESDAASVAMAKRNAKGTKTEVVHATSEQALDYISGDCVLIVDPPRAGLHKKVTARILDALPPKVIYLSCNPATQARDVALLQENYQITYAQGFNFFPRTPHIESLIVLEYQS